MARERLKARRVIDCSTRNRIAAEAVADWRTVDKVVSGEPVRSQVAGRILVVLQRYGIRPLKQKKANVTASEARQP